MYLIQLPKEILYDSYISFNVVPLSHRIRNMYMKYKTCRDPVCSKRMLCRAKKRVMKKA